MYTPAVTGFSHVHPCQRVLREGYGTLGKKYTLEKNWDLMGPDLTDGEAAITQHSLCLYLYTVKMGEAQNETKSAGSQCFAENAESKTFSELSVLQLIGRSTNAGHLMVGL